MTSSILPDTGNPAHSPVQRLPDHLANQIAAGEVVQRPESVVKELVENSIDAGATHVTIVVQQAGKALIQVIDDGAGMPEEDALLAFERHATSKIRSLGDLEQLVTFGFRGEALPSIASVSKIELRTRTAGDELAVVLRIDGGRLEERTRGAGPVGTSVAVRTLFFNTPARRQFLKADITEYRHIADTVQRYILSYPELRITFISDGQTIHDAHPGTLADRVEYLFGDRIAGSLIAVGEETDVMTVSGFVGRPDFARKTRGDQFLFVNGRYITSRLLNHAVVSAYEHLLGQGEYPLYVLFLNLDPKQIDVNVHPQKLEVKFGNERSVYTFLNAVVRRSLHRSDLAPSLRFVDDGGAPSSTRLAQPGDTTWDGGRRDLASISPDTPPHPAGIRGWEPDASRPAGGSGGSGGRDVSTGSWSGPAEEGRGVGTHGTRVDAAHGGRGGMDRGAGTRLDAGAIEDLFRTIRSGTGDDAPYPASGAATGDTTVLLPSEKPVSDTRFLWQLHNKYIFTPIKTGLMIIDQHVAHERILYERALAALEHAAPFSQQLLFPHPVRLSASDQALLRDILPDLRRLGFVVRIDAQQTVTVEAVPQDVRVGMEESILEEMLEQYKEYTGAGLTDVRHTVAASYGCRAAIKSGDKLTAVEMQSLIDQLFATRNPYTCPHGRPIIIKLPLEELDRRFGRTS